MAADPTGAYACDDVENPRRRVAHTETVRATKGVEPTHGRKGAHSTRPQAGAVPDRGVREGEAARDRAAGPHRHDDPSAVQEAAEATPEGDLGPRAAGRAAHQATRRAG